MTFVNELGVLVEYFLYATNLLIDSIDYIPIFFGWLPSGVLAILGATVAVAAVYKLMGWS